MLSLDIYELIKKQQQQQKNLQPWLVWLRGLSAGLQTKRSLVQFPVRARAWVAGQAPSGRHVKSPFGDVQEATTH